MKYRTGINYTFLLLALGIVSTILSTPISAQTGGNSQNQTGTTSGSGQQQQGGQGTAPAIGSIEDLKKLTTPEGPPPKTSNDTTPLFQQLGKETGTDNQTAGQGQQQQQGGNQTGQGQQQQQGGNQTGQGQQQQQGGNQTGQGQQQGGQQQEGNQTAGTAGGQQPQPSEQGQQQQEGNQTGQQQKGNETGGPLSEVGEAIGKLFQ
jgi:hypothetical protein